MTSTTEDKPMAEDHEKSDGKYNKSLIEYLKI